MCFLEQAVGRITPALRTCTILNLFRAKRSHAQACGHMCSASGACCCSAESRVWRRRMPGGATSPVMGRRTAVAHHLPRHRVGPRLQHERQLLLRHAQLCCAAHEVVQSPGPAAAAHTAGTAAWRQRHRSPSDAVRDRSHHARGTASRRHLLQAVCAAVQSTGQVGDLIQSTPPAGLLTQKCFAVCCTLQAVHLVGITKTGHRDAGAMSRLLEPCGPQLMNGTTCAPLCGGQWVTMTAHQCLPLKIPGRRHRVSKQ